MSDAALNKRWKNLEDYISRKNPKDKDDALSHASQYLETQSKSDIKSQTAKNFNQ